MEAGFLALETTTPESNGRPNYRWCFAFWNFASGGCSVPRCTIFLRSGYDLGTSWARAGCELQRSRVQAPALLGYELRNSWVYELGRTACELGTGMPSPRLPSQFLNRRGQGGESAKGYTYRGFEESQCRGRTRRNRPRAKKRPSPSPGS